MSQKTGPKSFKEINQEISTLTTNSVKIETDEKSAISKIEIVPEFFIEFDKKSILHSMHRFDNLDVKKYPAHLVSYFINENNIVIDTIKNYESKYTFQITDINICNIDCSIANGGYVSIDERLTNTNRDIKNLDILISFVLMGVSSL